LLLCWNFLLVSLELKPIEKTKVQILSYRSPAFGQPKLLLIIEYKADAAFRLPA
jgi:hypothetical protein